MENQIAKSHIICKAVGTQLVGMWISVIGYVYIFQCQLCMLSSGYLQMVYRYMKLSLISDALSYIPIKLIFIPKKLYSKVENLLEKNWLLFLTSNDWNILNISVFMDIIGHSYVRTYKWLKKSSLSFYSPARLDLVHKNGILAIFWKSRGHIVTT